MIYKYPPLYKYVIYFVLIYLFVKHQNIVPSNILLLNSSFCLIVIIMLDNILIKDHTSLLGNNFKIIIQKDKSDDIEELEDDEEEEEKEEEYEDDEDD